MSNIADSFDEGRKNAIFKSEDVRRILRNKHIVIIGDSVQRAVYQDLVLLLQDDRLLTPYEQRMKGDLTFLNDVLVFRSPLTNFTTYSEVREYQSRDGFHLVQYYFVTRCYDDKVETILEMFAREKPDLILMNSCLWDISRYGQAAEGEYQLNMRRLLTRLKMILPKTSTFLWLTTMPLASKIVGGFLLENIQFMSETLRTSILEANFYISQLVIEYGFDVLDLHFYMRTQLDHRNSDGVHWDGFAHRYISNMVIAFLLDTWCQPLPAYTIDYLRRDSGNTNVEMMSTLMDTTKPKFILDRINTMEKAASSVQAGAAGGAGSGPPTFAANNHQHGAASNTKSSGSINGNGVPSDVTVQNSCNNNNQSTSRPRAMLLSNPQYSSMAAAGIAPPSQQYLPGEFGGIEIPPPPPGHPNPATVTPPSGGSDSSCDVP